MNVTGESVAQKLLSEHESLALGQKRSDLVQVMSSPEGRRLVWDLIVSAGVFESSFAGDPLQTAFREGQRSVGIDLFERVKADATDLYITALNEQLAAGKTRKALRDAAELEAKAKEQEDNA